MQQSNNEIMYSQVPNERTVLNNRTGLMAGFLCPNLHYFDNSIQFYLTIDFFGSWVGISFQYWSRTRLQWKNSIKMQNIARILIESFIVVIKYFHCSNYSFRIFVYFSFSPSLFHIVYSLCTMISRLFLFIFWK